MSLDRKRTECGAADAVATETRSVSRCRSAEMAAVDGQVLRQISQIELERLLAMRLFPAKKKTSVYPKCTIFTSTQYLTERSTTGESSSMMRENLKKSEKKEIVNSYVERGSPRWRERLCVCFGNHESVICGWWKRVNEMLWQRGEVGRKEMYRHTVSRQH